MKNIYFLLSSSKLEKSMHIKHFSLILMWCILYYAIIHAMIGIWIEIIMNYRSPTMTGKRFTYEANLSNIANLWETICWGPWIAASSQYSLICSAIFLHKLIILIMIYFKKRHLNLNELKFHGCTQYLGSKLSIEIIHIMGQIGIAEGPFFNHTWVKSRDGTGQFFTPAGCFG